MDSEGRLTQELRKAAEKISEHPGYSEYLELEALGRSIRAVFIPNRDEVLSLLDRAATDWRLTFELVQNVRAPTVREQFHALLTRHLHNYLASAASLRDHVYRLMVDRTGPIVAEFQRKKEEMLLNREVPLGFELRNYVSHRKLPVFAQTMSWTKVNTPDQKIEGEVELNVAELLEWDKWSSANRAYLERLGDAVTLRPLIRRHAELVLDLNEWLLNELAQANASALDEVNELVLARNAIQTGGNLEEARRLSMYEET